MNLQRYIAKSGRATGDSLGISKIQSGPLLLADDLKTLMDKMDDHYGQDYQAKWSLLSLMAFDDDVELEEEV